MSLVALLPMKAHSERVPSKNFRTFAGKPLYRWMLDTLLDIPTITKVVINTDARHMLDISDIPHNERVFVRDRKAELCGDFVSMNLVIDDDIKNVHAESYLMSHTTNPLLKSDTVTRAIMTFQKGQATHAKDSLFTVTKHQTRFYKADGSAINHDPNHLLRTQDLEPWFEENSNLYLFTKESFSRTNARIGRNPILFETPKSESFDIDDMEDWDIAEAQAYNRLNKGE